MNDKKVYIFGNEAVLTEHQNTMLLALYYDLEEVIPEIRNKMPYVEYDILLKAKIITEVWAYKHASEQSGAPRLTDIGLALCVRLFGEISSAPQTAKPIHMTTNRK